MNTQNKPAREMSENPFRDFDIVFSSKARLARNLADYHFPGTIQEKDLDRLENKLNRVLQHLPGKACFRTLEIKDLDPLFLKELQEKNWLEPRYHYRENHPVIINKCRDVLIKTGKGEHIRLISILPGLSLSETYDTINQMDSQLEESLDYAFSLEWGYHGSSVVTLGTGLKVSVILHLPALTITSLIGDVISNVPKHEIQVKSLFQDGENNPGNLYQFYNHIAYGNTEKRIIEGLIQFITPVINLERKARYELHTGNRLELEDRIFRAFGILRHARLIPFKEAIEHLSFLRLGICSGIVENLSLENITALFFLIMDDHLKKLVKKIDSTEKDDKFINRTRAKMIRDMISRDDDLGGIICLKD